MSPRASLVAALGLCLASSSMAQLGSIEMLYHKSLKAYNQGKYQEAMEGFMDVYLEDPLYPDAQKYLSLSGQAMLKEEKARVYEERRDILVDILNMKRQLDPLMAQKASETKLWEKALKGVLAQAQDTKNLRAALFSYEKALEIFPRYSDRLDAFLAARDKFYAAYEDTQRRAAQNDAFGKRDYNPTQLEDPQVRNASPLASAGRLILRDREENDSAVRIRVLEERLDRDLNAAQFAYKRFDDRDYAIAARLWEQLATEQPANLEARYYFAQSRAHIQEEIEEREAEMAAAAPPPAALPPAAAPRPAEPPPPPPPLRTPRPAPSARRAAPMTAPLPDAAPAPYAPTPPAPIAAAPARVEPAAAVDETAVAPPLAISAQEYYLKGLRAYSTGDLKVAIEYWRNCIDQEPEHPKAKKALARAMRELK